MSQMVTSVMNSNLQSVEYFSGEGPVHRLALHPDKLLDSWNGNKTVQEAVFWALRQHREKRALGCRRVLPDGAWGGYEYLTYEQLEAEVKGLASGMRDLGLDSSDAVGIYSENRVEWIVSALACCYLNITFVPLYDSVAQDAIQYIIDHSEVSTLIISEKMWSKFVERPRELGKLEVLIKMGGPAGVPANLRTSTTIRMCEYDTVKRGSGACPIVPASPSDLFTILYTSGTMGQPKGAMLTESNVVCSIAGCLELISLRSSDVHMSYLPLAHSYELVCILSGFVAGASAGFWRGDIAGLLEDIQALRPSILIGVPRVFDRIYGRIMCGVEEAGRMKRMLFNYAYDSKRLAMESGGTSPLLNRMVFQRFGELLGGRLRMIVSGSAPLSPKVQEFLRVVTDAVTIQGYGLTETSALTSVQLQCDPHTTGHVGPPFGTVEIKLVDVPELEYVSTGSPQRGEICVRGTNVFVGYYKQAECTREVLGSDGWFHTGDVGEWLPTGALKIIDRKKNIFKLSQGEYVAIDNLESVFSQAKLVAQIYIHGDSLSSYLVAVVVPDAESLIGWAKSAGLGGTTMTMQALCAHPAAKRAVYDELRAAARESALCNYEVPRQLHLEPEPWTVESGLLTPSLKVRHPIIKKKYSSILADLYVQPRLDGNGSRARL